MARIKSITKMVGHLVQDRPLIHSPFGQANAVTQYRVCMPLVEPSLANQRRVVEIQPEISRIRPPNFAYKVGTLLNRLKAQGLVFETRCNGLPGVQLGSLVITNRLVCLIVFHQTMLSACRLIASVKCRRLHHFFDTVRIKKSGRISV